MFNATFYPTPKNVARLMLRGLSFGQNDYVLDPEAGKADLLDAAKEQYPYAHYYACEINPDLCQIIEGKGYPIVGREFLEYFPTIHFTHILANPPFDHAEDHLLHMWEILSSGTITCLMPSTIFEGGPNKKTSKEQLVIKLVQDHGKVEPIGSAFKDAERKTNVEVSIVRLVKESEYAEFGFRVSNDDEEEIDYEDKGREVALGGFVDNLLSSFDAATRGYSEYNLSRQRILRYVAPFGRAYDDRGNSHNIMDSADSLEDPKDRHNTFVSLLQSAAWGAILEHPKLQSMMTERARKSMQEFSARQKRVDFNRDNVMAMIDALTLKRDEFLTGAILDAFDTMTRYYKENRVHVEGWKSDVSWRVNYKVVLPSYLDYCHVGFRTRWGRRDSLNDIDRAMCVLSGKRFDDVLTIEKALEQAWKTDSWTPSQCESEFFLCRYYKKETLHLRFKDMKLLEDFNLAAARGKAWLPPG